MRGRRRSRDELVVPEAEGGGVGGGHRGRAGGGVPMRVDAYGGLLVEGGGGGTGPVRLESLSAEAARPPPEIELAE